MSQSLGTAVFIIVVIHPGLVKFLLVGVDGRHSLGDRLPLPPHSRVVLNCFYVMCHLHWQKVPRQSAGLACQPAEGV